MVIYGELLAHAIHCVPRWAFRCACRSEHW